MNPKATSTSEGHSRAAFALGPYRTEKITDRHLDQAAIVYIRQSTPQQVVQNRESTEVQYGLRSRAISMGWPEGRVLVIDDDLGKSGASSAGRLGFQRLVTEVSLNHVGIIFGVDMSRLARCCSDWYRLLEVCAVFGTLIADLDGVYDPSQYNDRLLLGLKGTMSEAELHILRQRVDRGRINKAERGKFIVSVPIGYVRRPLDEVAFDPDEEVQEVVRLIFRTFEETGSLFGTLRFLARNGVKLPIRERCGANKGQLEWRRPTGATLASMFRNPIYAGAYAYGKREVDPRRRIPGRRATGRRVVPAEKCRVLLRDRFPAYITWEQFQSYQERIRSNRSRPGEPGTPRSGPALLAGLVVCGRCGRRTGVNYHAGGKRHSYSCAAQQCSYGERSCQSISGAVLDAFVSQEVLRALEPASLELSLDAAGRIEQQRHDLNVLWQKRLERASIDAERAARHYRSIEPENRLVARTLAVEWEQKLLQQRALTDEHERYLRSQARTLTADERETIRRIADDLPGLWNAPTTTPIDRKEVVRQVIDRVVVDVDPRSEKVDLRIEWAGGKSTSHQTTRPVSAWRNSSAWARLAERLRTLVAEGLTTRGIAHRLHEEGWRPLHRRSSRFTVEIVRYLLEELDLLGSISRSRSKDRTGLAEDEWWLPSLAEKLNVTEMTLSKWARAGWLRARRNERGRWIVSADEAELDRLRAEIRPGRPRKDTHRLADPNQGQGKKLNQM